MNRLNDELAATVVTACLHLPLLLFLFSNGGESSETTQAELNVGVPSTAAADPPPPPQNEESTDRQVENLEKISTRPSNRVEAQQERISAMTEVAIAEAVSRYREQLDENDTQIQLLETHFLLSSAREFILEDISSHQRVHVDPFGEPAVPSVGSLQIDISKSRLPFNLQKVARSRFGIVSSSEVAAYVVIPADIELAMFRSLYEFLQKHGLNDPQPRTRYTGEVLYRSDLEFSWSSSASSGKGN